MVTMSLHVIELYEMYTYINSPVATTLEVVAINSLQVAMTTDMIHQKE